MENMQNQRGRDMAAPVREITLGGERHALAFTNKAARIAEDVYERQYGQDKGYAEILADLSKMKYKAIMAIFYGALAAGGSSMSWEEFDAAFKLDSIPGIREIITQGVVDALPRAEASEEGAQGANP